MDPNAALQKLRELSAAIDDAGSAEEAAPLAEEMAGVFDGLDDWLSKGGHRPTEWDAAVTS